MCCPHCGHELVYDDEWLDDWTCPECDFPPGWTIRCDGSDA